MIREEELQSRLADARDIDRNNQHRDFIQLASNDAVASSLINFYQDANWISSSKMLYEWRHNEPFQGTDEEAAKFGADYMTDFYDLFRNPDTPFWVSPAQNVVNALADFDDASPAQQMAFYYLQETYNTNDPVRAGVDQISSSASRDSDMTYQSLMEHNPKNVARDGVNAYVRNRVMDHLDFDEIELAQATRANNVARENLEKVHGRDMEAERQAVREFGSDIVGFGNSLFRVLVGGGRDAVQGVFDLGADIDGTVPLGKIAWGYGNGLEWVKPDDPRYNSMTITVPDVPHGGGAAEEFGRSITQFLTVFATGGGFIRLGGSGAMKMADIGTDIAAGVMADATFDPELGNIATMLREFNVDNELVRFLDSQVGEDALPRERLIARMKTAGLEGPVLGLAMHGFIEALSGIKRAGLVPQLKQWMETGTTKLDEWVPAPGELRMGVGPSDKKKIRTGLSFSQSDTEARVGRVVKRNIAAADGKPIPGAPKNERVVIKAPEGSGLPDFVVGDITFDDWITRTEMLSSPEDIAKASKWYSELRGHFLEWSDSPEEADKLMRAWLVANQNTDVGKAMANALSQREQIARGVAVDDMISGGLPHATAAARSVFFGEDIQGGVAQKISDFVDSAEGLSARSWMGGDERGGAPFVVDVHTARDTGMVDEALINHLIRLGYDEDQLTQLKRDYKNAPAETQYENRALFGMALTDHLNEIGWQGRSDWKPHEVQAVGWMGMINNFSGGTTADDISSALEQNLRRVSYEVSPGEGSPWAIKYGERFEALTPDAQIALTETVTARATEIAADIAGIDIRGIVHGTGGWENFQNPSTVLQSLSSPRAAEIAANTLGLLLNQTEVWVNSEPVPAVVGMATISTNFFVYFFLEAAKLSTLSTEFSYMEAAFTVSSTDPPPTAKTKS